MERKIMSSPGKIIENYQNRVIGSIKSFDWSLVAQLAQKILLIQKNGRQIFLCGNGGSSANAIHIANDLLYFRLKGRGMRVTALPANQAVLTCLANDIGYENVFSFQLEQLGKKGDLLIVLSGSGNSPNILEAVKIAKRKGILTCAILGFNGGKCLKLVDIPIHFAVNDMQVAEDLQLMVGHMLMQCFNGSICKDE